MNTDVDLRAELGALADLAPPDTEVRAALGHRIGVRARRRRTALLGAAAAAVVLLLAGGAGIAGSLISHTPAALHSPEPTVGSAATTQRPGTSAGSAATQRSVVTGYLDAVKAGDCTAANRYFADSNQHMGNGNLCPTGSLRLLGYRVDGKPATPSQNESVWAVTITTTGGDGSIPGGDTTWFLDVHRQSGGAWLITGGGTGP